ncbi:glycosyltransferase [Kibdelosporangium lantanae]
MSTPVSVAMTVAPKATYLPETLKSILGQTHQDWELVIVLDGECAENRAAAEIVPADRVRFATTPAPRSGPAVGRNLALRTATHELVAWLDADDLAVPERLARQVEVLEAQPDLGLLGSWAKRIDPAGAPVGEMHPPTGRDKVGHTMLWFNCLITSTVMMRASVANAVGGFDPVCTRSEDYDLWLRMLGSHSADILPEELVSYRVHPGQHSRGRILDAQVARLRRSRMAAAKRLGVSKVGALARHSAWLGVQVANRRW